MIFLHHTSSSARKALWVESSKEHWMLFRKQSLCRRHREPSELRVTETCLDQKNVITSLKLQRKELKSGIRGNLPQSTLLMRSISLQTGYLCGYITLQMTNIVSSSNTTTKEKDRVRERDLYTLVI